MFSLRSHRWLLGLDAGPLEWEIRFLGSKEVVQSHVNELCLRRNIPNHPNDQCDTDPTCRVKISNCSFGVESSSGKVFDEFTRKPNV
jgi:hypothetical protein